MGLIGDILAALFGSGGSGLRRSVARTPVPKIPGTSLPSFFRAEGVCPSTGERGDVGGVAFTDGFIGRLLRLNRGRLSYLAYKHPAPYRTHAVPKRDGGERIISEPVGPLKFAQRRILSRLLDRVELHDACHGFRRSRSIVTNAAPHVGKEVVVGMDLRDFFPTVTFPRVYGMFRSLEMAKREAALMAALTTHEGRLPQGAPTSPAIANIICRKLDRRLAGLARKAGADYTRYADDIAFSGPRSILSMLPAARAIIKEEGFEVHPAKTRIMGRGRRQQVTGLVVNEKVSVPRDVRRRLRALLHTVAGRGGLGAPDVPPGLAAHLRGHANFHRMVDPELGARCHAAIDAL